MSNTCDLNCACIAWRTQFCTNYIDSYMINTVHIHVCIEIHEKLISTPTSVCVSSASGEGSGTDTGGCTDCFKLSKFFYSIIHAHVHVYTCT